MALFRARSFVACVIALVSMVAAGAEAQPPTEAGVPLVAAGSPLRLRDAIVAALRGNPDLKGFAFSLRAQTARADGAALRPAPEISADLENFLGTGAHKGLSSVEASFALSQVVELGGKRNRRISVARSGLDVIAIEQKAAQLDVLAEVSRRFIEVVSNQQQLDLARQAHELARQTAVEVQQRVDAAKSPDAEIRRARVELKRRAIEQQHVEQQLQIARAKLAAMWGATQTSFGPAEADLFTLPTPGEFPALLARIEANPDFARFASEARVRDAELRLAQARRTPDIQLSLGVRRLQETRDQALIAGFSMPLFSRSQANPAIAEARALRDRVDAESDAHRIRVRIQLFELHQELRFSIDEARLLQDELIPEVQQALDETRYAYERGRYSYLELVDGQRTFLEIKRAQLAAAVNAQMLQTEIERLAGEPLAAPNP